MSLLNENNINYDLVEYLKNPLSVREIMSLSNKLGLNPGEFVRKSEKEISSHIDNITLLIDKANFLFLDLSIKKKIDQIQLPSEIKKSAYLDCTSIVSNSYKNIKKTV